MLLRGAVALHASPRAGGRCRRIVADASSGADTAELKHLRLRALENDLEAAIGCEHYAEAAVLRDEMQSLQLDGEVSVLAANERFYRAFNGRDLGAMQSVWSERDSVTCNHPGVPPLVGVPDIMESWKEIFDEGSAMTIETSQVRCQLAGGAACVTCVETLQPGDSLLIATNLYAESLSGKWEMILHHASPLMFRPGEGMDDDDGITVILD